MNRKYMTAALALAAAMGAWAQTDTLTTRSMTIEGTYRASVTEAQKEMPVPEKPQVTTTQQQVSYVTEEKPFTGFTRQSMQPMGQSLGQRYQYIGLARLGYGMRHNLDGLLDLGIDFSDNDHLKLNGNMSGWNTETIEDWRSKMFELNTSAGYEHNFRKFSVGADAGFSVERFNYLQTGMVFGDGVPRQFLVGGNAGVNMKSHNTDVVDFSLSAGWYGLSAENTGYNPVNGRENLIRVAGHIGYNYGDGRIVLEYKQKTAFYDWRTRVGSVMYDNYTTLSLTPYLTWQNEDIHALAGMDVNIHTDEGHLFQFSPKVEASYRLFSNLDLIAKVNGGIQDYDMRYMYAFSPYWSDSRQIRDGYAILNLQAGAVYSPLEYISLSLTAGERVVRNDLFQIIGLADILDDQTSMDNSIVTSSIVQDKSNLLFAELTGKVAVAEWLKGDFLVGGYKWGVVDSREALMMRPAFKAEGHVRGNLFGVVNADLSYRYHILTEHMGNRFSALNDLGASVDYTWRDNLTFTVKGTNLLNRHCFMYAGYPMQNWAITGGVAYRF
ncbi:MAG: hypothetical protein MJY79_03215 [Bacteroidaceae bacterium]|nr:hypothetical protein [Bacteroidaceae bacterium]